jgi:hypothetical protein
LKNSVTVDDLRPAIQEKPDVIARLRNVNLLAAVGGGT